jgi:hypothetical protein
MRMRRWILAAGFLAAAGCAHAASRDLPYGPPAACVISPPTLTNTDPVEGAGVLVIHTDIQARLGNDSDYSTDGLKILTP